MFACFDLELVQKIRQVTSKSLLETQTSQMYIDDSVNAVYFLTHQTVNEAVLQVSWSGDETWISKLPVASVCPRVLDDPCMTI